MRRVTLTKRGRRVVDLARSLRAELEKEFRVALGPRAIATAKRVLAALLDEAGGSDAVKRRRVRPPSP